MDNSSDENIALLNNWLRRATISLEAHYNAARRYRALHYWIGIPAIALSSAVGTVVFASLENEVGNKWKFLIAFLSISAALLTALQTFLRFSELAEKHRLVGARYGAIAREIEQLMILSRSNLKNRTRAFNDVRTKLNNMAEEAPSVPNKLLKRAEGNHPKEDYVGLNKIVWFRPELGEGDQDDAA